MTGLTFGEMEMMSASAKAMVEANGGVFPWLDPDVTVKTVRRLWDYHATHPLFLRYFNHNRNTSNNFNREPWTAIGERMMVAQQLLGPTGLTPLTGHTRAGGAFGNADASYWLGLSMAVESLAVPYLLLTEPAKIIRQTPVPPHIVSRDMLPFPMMFFSYETAWEAAEGSTNWFVLQHRTDRLEIIFDQMLPDGSGVVIQGGYIPYRLRYPDDYEKLGAGEFAWTRFLVALFGFINSPYTDVATHRLPRSIRREIVRSGHAKPEDTEMVVNTIVLRRREDEKSDRSTNGESENGRTYHHRWWVSGHMRAQWYPATNAHKVIWIAPYLKGPTDKPILEKTYVVAR